MLIVSTIAPTIRQFLRPFARHFRAQGWRVDAAAAGAASDAGLADDFDHRYELPISRSILDLRGIWRGSRALSRVLETRPDIVHVHTPIASFLTRYAVRRVRADLRPRVVYTAHGFHFVNAGRAVPNAIFEVAERLAGPWTDRLVVVNRQDFEAATRLRLVPLDRLQWMPGIGIDTGHFARHAFGADQVSAARRQLGIDVATPLFVVLGELTPNKRPADVVLALARMRNRAAQVVYAGAGDERSRVAATAMAAGVADRVHLIGRIDDVRPLVATATALVLASAREGLNRSVMEGLSLETPVVASTARGNDELVGTDGGLLFTVGDVDALAGHLDWIVDHPAEAIEMGRRGRARMVGRHDVSTIIRLHEEMYRGLLEAPRTSSAGGRS